MRQCSHAHAPDERFAPLDFHPRFTDVRRPFTQGSQDRDRMTLVVTKLYFKDGRVKIELRVAKGKKLFDKRRTLRQKDADKEGRAAIRSGKRG